MLQNQQVGGEDNEWEWHETQRQLIHDIPLIQLPVGFQVDQQVSFAC